MRQMISVATARRPKRRGARRQRRRRRAERTVRRAALVYCRWCGRLGVSLSQASRRIGLRPETVHRWHQAWPQDLMRPTPRGRPIARIDAEVRRAIVALLELTGLRGLPTLRELFPTVSRSELVELQRWHIRRSRHGRRRLIRALHWTRPGSVWAMDFSDPPAPIDGFYTKLLCIRDLASGCMLMALPCPDATARTVLTALRAITRWNPVPLVIKCDNGSAFASHEVKQWAKSRGIQLLFSPAGTPEYNGSIESGIGSIKTRSLWIAGRHDRPWHWTCDDVEAARCEANELARPRGPCGGSPNEAWSNRLPLDEVDRNSFINAYRACYARERQRHGLLDGIELQHEEQAAIDRVAITRALVEQGLLH
ncbi:MAG: transposase family protein, partial [Gammaproteobacteria bacterium]|nr:transposase family protein [Gammaproteobacteria bacterium]